MALPTTYRGRDLSSGCFVAGLQHVDRLGEDEIGQQKLRLHLQIGGRTSSQVDAVAGQVSDQDVGDDNRSPPGRGRSHASGLPEHIVPTGMRLAEDTWTVPASERKLGVRPSTARLPSTRDTSSSPCRMPSASRTAFGRVTRTLGARPAQEAAGRGAGPGNCATAAGRRFNGVPVQQALATPTLPACLVLVVGAALAVRELLPSSPKVRSAVPHAHHCRSTGSG